MSRKFFIGVGVLIAVFAAVGAFARAGGGWTEAQLAQLRNFAIGSLAPLPADPSNRVADDPRAAHLGQRIFFDTRFSANGEVACATCHLPDMYKAIFGPMPDLAALPAHAGPVQDPAARAPWDRMSTAERDAVTRVFATPARPSPPMNAS